MLSQKQFNSINLNDVCEVVCKECEYKKFIGYGYTCTHEDEEDKCSLIKERLEELWEKYLQEFGV